jgi:hypothetical protein
LDWVALGWIGLNRAVALVWIGVALDWVGCV